MKPTDRYLMIINDHDSEARRKAIDKLEEVARLLDVAEEPTVKLMPDDGPVPFHETTYPAHAFWRSKDRPLSLKASVSAGGLWPNVRLNVVDLQAAHTTTFISPLRLDHANLIKPGQPAADLYAFINEFYKSILHAASPYDSEEELGRVTFETLSTKLEADVACLIRAYADGQFVDPDGRYAYVFHKPFHHLCVTNCDRVDHLKTAPQILTPGLAAALEEPLPELVTLGTKETRRILGFSLGCFRAGPFDLTEPKSVVEDMKCLARFARLDPADLFLAAPAALPIAA